MVTSQAPDNGSIVQANIRGKLPCNRSTAEANTMTCDLNDGSERAGGLGPGSLNAVE